MRFPRENAWSDQTGFSRGFRRCAPISPPACGGALPKARKKQLEQAQLLFSCLLAERRGFEPLCRFRRQHAFQACLLSHSSISPVCVYENGFICRAQSLCFCPHPEAAGFLRTTLHFPPWSAHQEYRARLSCFLQDLPSLW